MELKFFKNYRKHIHNSLTFRVSLLLSQTTMKLIKLPIKVKHNSIIPKKSMGIKKHQALDKATITQLEQMQQIVLLENT